MLADFIYRAPYPGVGQQYNAATAVSLGGGRPHLGASVSCDAGTLWVAVTTGVATGAHSWSRPNDGGASVLNDGGVPGLYERTAISPDDKSLILTFDGGMLRLSLQTDGTWASVGLINIPGHPGARNASWDTNMGLFFDSPSADGGRGIFHADPN